MATNEKMKEIKEGSKEGSIEGAKLRIKNEISEEISEKNRLNGLAKAKGFKGMAKDRMNAKCEILALWQSYFTNSKESKTVAQFLFISAYNSRQLEVDEEIRAVLPTISQPSLIRWIKKSKSDGIASLAGSYGNRKGSGIIDSNQQMRAFVLAMLKEIPHVKGIQIFHAMCARFEGQEIPSARTIERWLENWKSENIELFTAMNQPDQWKNKFMLAFGDTTEKIERYLQQWQMDSTPTDIMLSDGRHTILGVIDVWSRRVRFLVCRTGKASAVSALIRRALIEWGVPEEIKMDNGSDYKSKQVARVLEALNIKQTFCTPFSPWEKPQIERVFETFSHGLLELCPQFIGHNVAERRSIEERKCFADRLMNKDGKGNRKRTSEEPINGEFISSIELQEICDKWTKGFYWINKHSELGVSPMERVASYNGTVRRISTDAIRGLDVLLSPVAGNEGRRKVGKNGISVNNWDYWADELISFNGQVVLVYEDLTDYGRVTVLTTDFDFICVAVCPEILGIDREEMANHAKAVQKKRIREKQNEIKTLTSGVSLKGIHNEILDHYVKKADEITRKPNESVEEYTTRRLEAATDAALTINELEKEPDFETLNQPQVLDENTEKKLAEIVRLDLKRETDEERENREKGERMSRYEALEAVNFEGISPENEAWRRSWERTPEYAAYRCLGNIFKSNSK